MDSVLLCLRHGVRGVRQLESIQLPYLAPDYNLSLHGHVQSYQLGEWINEHIGHPDFVYAYNGTERTISTAIALARGAEVDYIWMNQDERDPLFWHEKDTTSHRARRILDYYLPELLQLRHMVMRQLASNLPTDPDALLADLRVLAQMPTFARLSGISTPLAPLARQLERVIGIAQQSELRPTQHMLPILNGLMAAYSRTVLVCGDSHIYMLGTELGHPYMAPPHSPHYVPPNSGFILQKKGNNLAIGSLIMRAPQCFEIVHLCERPVPTMMSSIGLLQQYLIGHH